MAPYTDNGKRFLEPCVFLIFWRFAMPVDSMAFAENEADAETTSFPQAFFKADASTEEYFQQLLNLDMSNNLGSIVCSTKKTRFSIFCVLVGNFKFSKISKYLNHNF